jgi:hypothetical protein
MSDLTSVTMNPPANPYQGIPRVKDPKADAGTEVQDKVEVSDAKESKTFDTLKKFARQAAVGAAVGTLGVLAFGSGILPMMGAGIALGAATGAVIGAMKGFKLGIESTQNDSLQFAGGVMGAAVGGGIGVLSGTAKGAIKGLAVGAAASMLGPTPLVGAAAGAVSQMLIG